MDYKEIAKIILDDLNAKGAELGNASIGIIKKTLESQLVNNTDGKKHTVYVAWEREDANKLENGKIALSKVQKFEFDTIGEVRAFRKGIEQCAGNEQPFHVADGEFVIKNNNLLLK